MALQAKSSSHSSRHLGRYLKLLIYLLSSPREVAAVILLTAVSSMLGVLQPWPLKMIADHFQQVAAPMPPYLAWLAASPWHWNPTAAVLVGATALSAALVVINAWLAAVLTQAWANIGQNSVYEIGNQLYAKLIRLSPSFYRSCPPGDAMERFSIDSYSAFGLAKSLVIDPLQALITLLSLAIVSWHLNRHLTIAAYAIVPILTIITWKSGSRLKGLMRTSRIRDSELLNFSLTTMNTIPLVQASQMESHNDQRFRSIAEQSIEVAKRHAVMSGLLGITGSFVSSFSGAIILAFGAFKVLTGELSVGSLIVILAYLDQIRGAALKIFSSSVAMQSISVGVDRVWDVLQAQNLVESVHDSTISLPPLSEGSEIQYRNVSLKLHNSPDVLLGITLRILPGEHLAIVGKTGSGKSSLVASLLRFYDPCEGEIFIDGVDTQAFQLQELRERMAYLPQSPRLANLSIAENIAFSEEHPNHERVVESAKRALAHHFILALPDGYNTIVDPKHPLLSGGQIQRIALARVFYKNSPIMILDEPTSALDSETEQALIASLQEATKGHTVLMIAHRLSTLTWVDRIAVMESGRLVELGTKEQLLQAKGLFHAMAHQDKLQNSSMG